MSLQESGEIFSGRPGSPWNNNEIAWITSTPQWNNFWQSSSLLICNQENVISKMNLPILLSKGRLLNAKTCFRQDLSALWGQQGPQGLETSGTRQSFLSLRSLLFPETPQPPEIVSWKLQLENRPGKVLYVGQKRGLWGVELGDGEEISSVMSVGLFSSGALGFQSVKGWVFDVLFCF